MILHERTSVSVPQRASSQYWPCTFASMRVMYQESALDRPRSLMCLRLGERPAVGSFQNTSNLREHPCSWRACHDIMFDDTQKSTDGVTRAFKEDLTTSCFAAHGETVLETFISCASVLYFLLVERRFSSPMLAG